MKIEKNSRKTDLDEAVLTGLLQLMDKRRLWELWIPILSWHLWERLLVKNYSSFEYATEHRLPVTLFTASGSAHARGDYEFNANGFQSVPTVRRHFNAGLFYLTVLTDPTTSGVTASFIWRGDIILAGNSSADWLCRSPK